MNSFKTIAWITTAIFALITLIAQGPSTYRFAIVFLAPMLWAVYFLRDRLHIHACHFAIFATALVLHNLGAFGSYQEQYFGLDFADYTFLNEQLATHYGVAGVTGPEMRRVQLQTDRRGGVLSQGAVLTVFA